MSFVSPEYFWLLLFLVAGLIKKDFRSLNLTSYGYLLTFVFIVLALSRPVIEQEPLKSEELLSDVIFGVDLSYSMQAEDIKPSRLGKAKDILSELVQVKQKSRFGVLGFTTNAIILSPLTEDSELLLHLFNALDEKLIVTKGSDLFSALKLARKMSHSKKVSLVLLSDGGDKLSYEEEAKFAQESGLIVNILMLGTEYGATLSTLNGELLKDEEGAIVVSRANSAASQISKQSGGVFTQDVATLLDALERQSKRDYETETTRVRNLELFYYFVFVAILLFLVSVTTL